jgi:hypothetical protein
VLGEDCFESICALAPLRLGLMQRGGAILSDLVDIIALAAFTLLLVDLNGLVCNQATGGSSQGGTAVEHRSHSERIFADHILLLLVWVIAHLGGPDNRFRFGVFGRANICQFRVRLTDWQSRFPIFRA